MSKTLNQSELRQFIALAVISGAAEGEDCEVLETYRGKGLTDEAIEYLLTVNQKVIKEVNRDLMKIIARHSLLNNLKS